MTEQLTYAALQAIKSRDALIAEDNTDAMTQVERDRRLLLEFINQQENSVRRWVESYMKDGLRALKGGLAAAPTSEIPEHSKISVQTGYEAAQEVITLAFEDRARQAQ